MTARHSDSEDFSDSTMEPPDEGSVDMLERLIPIARAWRWLVFGPLVVGLIALGIAFVIKPTFTASAVFMPPQQQQSQAAATLASLGALASLAGANSPGRTPADQYIALLQSVTLSERIIERFKLMEVYEETFRVDARRELDKRTRFSVGKKDGLIRVEVDDKVPERAANMANAYVEELRKLSASLALTEAQQRRVFFENQLQATRERLTQAQQRLEASGIGQGALRAEPKAAAEAYAKLRAETTAAEVRLRSLRQTLSENTPEVKAAQSVVASLSQELQKAERQSVPAGPDADYISRYRDYKYQETLLDLFARQYELARVDEAKEGALFQVIDPATPPEKKSAPKRLLVAAVSALVAFVVLLAIVLVRSSWARIATDPQRAGAVAQLRKAWGNRP